MKGQRIEEINNRVRTWKEFWNSLATSRDPIAATDRPTVSPERYQLYSSEIIQKLALSKDDLLLDIGCGTGIIDASLAEHVERIIATDFSETMTQKTRLNTGQCGNVYVVNSDSTALPLKDGIFSKVLIYAVAQYLSKEQIKQMLVEVKRLSKPAGLIMLGEIPRARDTSLWSRIKDVWIHRGLKGILSRILHNLFEHFLRITGRWTQQFVRPKGPPETLHSEEELLSLVHQCGMRGRVLPLNKKMLWSHHSFDLLIENIPPVA